MALTAGDTAEERPKQPHLPSPGRVRLPARRRRPLAFVWVLGPGLTAGASDNDPTTVASLAVIGATTVYDLSWLVLLLIPMLMIVQTVSATVGVVARTGLVAATRTHYGRAWALAAVPCVLAVNVLTLAADLEGGGAALGLLTGWPYQWFIVPFAIVIGGFLVWGSFPTLQRTLRAVLLLFGAYVITAFLARPDWGDVLAHTVVPHFNFRSAADVTATIALLGTTLTSYVYLWEMIAVGAEQPPLRQLGRARADANLGMVIVGVLFWFIVIATGATLGVHHRPVQTAQEAAQALTPLAGPFAALIFGVGLLASAIVAVVVLAGTSAYVVAEAFDWRRSLDARFHHAPRFYAAMLISLAAGVGLTFLGVAPIQLLFTSSIAGGLATPVTLFLLIRLARDRRVMGERRIGRSLSLAGFAVMGVVTLASALYLWQAFA